MDTPQDNTTGIMQAMIDIRSDVNDLKTSHPNEHARIQDALNDLLHAQIMIDNVLM